MNEIIKPYQVKINTTNQTMKIQMGKLQEDSHTLKLTNRQYKELIQQLTKAGYITKSNKKEAKK